VDNTPPSAPTNLLLLAGYDEGEFVVSANWDDTAGAASYRVERCEGLDCSSFAQIDTSLTSDYSDQFLAEGTIYCYKVRSVDAAQNPSTTYSDTECIRTLSVAEFPDPPSLPTTTAGSVITLPAALPGAPTDTAASTITLPGVPSIPSDTAGTTPVFPDQPGVPTSP
jgi:hypothetical protein